MENASCWPEQLLEVGRLSSTRPMLLNTKKEKKSFGKDLN